MYTTLWLSHNSFEEKVKNKA